MVSCRTYHSSTLQMIGNEIGFTSPLNFSPFRNSKSLLVIEKSLMMIWLYRVPIFCIDQ